VYGSRAHVIVDAAGDASQRHIVLGPHIAPPPPCFTCRMGTLLFTWRRQWATPPSYKPSSVTPASIRGRGPM